MCSMTCSSKHMLKSSMYGARVSVLPWGLMKDHRLCGYLQQLWTQVHSNMDPGPSHLTMQYRSVAFRGHANEQSKLDVHGIMAVVIPLHEFPASLIASLTPSVTSSSTVTAPVRSHGHGVRRAKPSIHVLTWNPGGLADMRFSEFKTWLAQTDFNVVILPETRWNFENDWEDSQWCYVHSGTPATQRVSGVSTMISKRLCKSCNILWTSVHPGRLLRIRLLGMVRNIDIVALYQASVKTPFNPGVSKDERAQVFQQLDNLLTTLPQRNVLVVAGDFNCSL